MKIKENILALDIYLRENVKQNRIVDKARTTIPPNNGNKHEINNWNWAQDII